MENMIAAIFKWEMLLAARRQRGFYLRWIYAAFLLAQIAPVFYLSKFAWNRLINDFSVYAFFENFLTQHYTILVLLTPAMVGGTIAEEKRRGTLQLLLTARTRTTELILGKIFANVYQMMLLSLVGLPLFAFFAGIANNPYFLPAIVLSSLALIFGIAALTTCFSVWCRTTRSALLCVYLLMAATVLLLPFLGSVSWLVPFNPLRVLSLDDPSLLGRHLFEFCRGWLIVGFGAVVLASMSLRTVFRRQLQISQPKRARWWRGNHGRVRGNPVLWREQKVEGIAPFEALGRFPRWIGMLTVMVGSTATLVFLLFVLLPPADKPWLLIQGGEWKKLREMFLKVSGDAFYWQGLAATVVLTLMVAIRASGSITSEKEKGTWFALLLTPMTTKKIVTGKHWGIFWAYVPYIVAHAAVTLLFSFVLGISAVAWAVLWMAAMFMATIVCSALGLWCSAGSVSSWRSLVTTLVLFYLGWLFFFMPVTFVLFLFKGVIEVFLMIVSVFGGAGIPTTVIGSDSIFFFAVCFAVIFAFWSTTQRLLEAAVTRVGRNERVSELGFDYYSLYSDYFRRKQEEKWESPRIDEMYEMEVMVLGEEGEKKRSAIIPFQ